jgi:hypothetical protein
MWDPAEGNTTATTEYCIPSFVMIMTNELGTICLILEAPG